MNPATTTARTLTVRRRIDAAAEELFDTWLEPASLAEWMRPGNIEKSVATVDAKVGGTFEILMIAGDATHAHTGTYRIIDRPRRLAFTWISGGTKQTETLVTVDFHASPKGTEVVLTHAQLPDDVALQQHAKGWERIVELLAMSFTKRPRTARV